jgi:hypothetical protein
MVSGTAPSVARIGRDLQRHHEAAGDAVLGARATRWLDSPLVLALGAAVAATVFVVLRMVVAGHGNIAGFILVGRSHLGGSGLPRGVPVGPALGYDGQFYYRLALDPLAWGHSAFGITLDLPYRISRIGYPALAWLTAGGRSFLVPVTLVAVNVVAFAVLVASAATLAREAGRAAAWGLVVAGFWGFLWTLGRDLTELVAAAAVVAGLLAIRRRRFIVAGLVLGVGVLSRETVLVLIAAIVLARVVGWVRFASGRRPRAFTGGAGDLTRSGPGREDVPWLLPLAAFVGWQGAVWARTGTIPIRSSGRSNVGAPFSGLVHGFDHYSSLLLAHDAVIWMAELAVLVVVIAAAVYASIDSRAQLHEKAAWIGYGALMVCLQSTIWLGDVGFRSLDDVFVLSGIVMLYSRRRLYLPAALVACTWAGVFVQLVRTI